MIGFDPLLFFEWLPRIALIGLVLIIALTAWMIWRSVSPAAPGISLGYYEIFGRYAGKKLVKRIKGTLVEATALFLNPEVEREFKELLLQDIDDFLKHDPGDSDLQAARDKLKEYSLSDMCRIIVTREKLFSKHVIVQHGRLRPLNTYAAHDPSSKFTLGMGFLCQGVISGVIHTLPQKWNIYRLGKVSVHLFLPDSGEEQPIPPPEGLAKIALLAPASVEYEHLLKSKDEQLKAKEQELDKMGKDLSAIATERDGLRRAVAGFSVTGGNPESLTRRFDLADFIAVSVPVIVGYFLADYSKVQPIVGIFLGLIFGAFLLYKRR